MLMNGLHIVAELCDCHCPPSLLRRADALRDLCRAVCSVPGLTPLGEIFHQFTEPEGKNAGATGAVILAESHLAVHTWPEISAVTLDLYVCNFTQDNRAAACSVYDRIATAFAPRRVKRREIERELPYIPESSSGTSG